MTITYQYVVLSWNGDLTNPFGESHPFLFVLYGETPMGQRVAAFDYQEPNVVLDQLAKEILYSTCFTMTQDLEQRGWDAFEWLTSMQQSIHTSEVSEKFEVGVGESLQGSVLELVVQESPLGPQGEIFFKEFREDNASSYDGVGKQCH